MVRVPEYTPSVPLRPQYQSDWTVRANAEQFGAAVGRGMQNLGQGISRLASSVAAVQELEDEARVREARNLYMQERDRLMYDPEIGYMHTQGKNALDQRTTFQENVRKLREKYAKGLSPKQQGLFSRSIEVLELDAQRSAMVHSGNELKSYVVKQSEAAASNFLNEAMRNIGNKDMYDKYVAASLNEIKNIAGLRGLSAEEIDKYQREFLSKATHDTALMMAQKDALAAERFIQENANRLTPQDKLAVEDKIANSVYAAKVEQGVAFALGGLPSEIDPVDGTDIKPSQSEIQRSELPMFGGDPLAEDDGEVTPRLPVEGGGSVVGAGAGDPSTALAAQIMGKYVGLHERTDNKAIADFIRNATGFNINPAVTPWCAAFVNAALGAAGIKGTGSLAARSFLNFGIPVTEPKVGDIVVLSRGNNPAQGHVGFFQGYDSNGNILVLGGNQGNRVSVASYSPKRLLGFRRAGHVDERTAKLPNYTPKGLAQIYDRVQQIPDVKVRAGVMKAVSEQMTARKKLIDAQREEAQSYVEQQIIADPSFDPMKLPIEAQMALGASGLRAAMEFKQKVTEWGEPQTDPETWQKILDMYADDPAQFAEMEIWQLRPSLSNDHYKMVQEWRSSARANRRKAREEGPDIASAMRQAEVQLKAILPEKNKKKAAEMVAQFQSALMMDMKAFKDDPKNDGRAPNTLEIQQMINRRLLPMVVGGRPGAPSFGPMGIFQSLFGSGSRETFLFEGPSLPQDAEIHIDMEYEQIPAADRIEIERAYAEKYGKLPTPDEVEVLYETYIATMARGPRVEISDIVSED